MLKRLVLRNFKSFVEEQAHLSPFTLLIGANGAGKSNFLDALRLLHGLSHGWPLWHVANGRTEGSTKVWDGIRGGTQELVRIGATHAEIECLGQHTGDIYDYSLRTDGKNILRESVANLVVAERDSVAGKVRIRYLPGNVETGEELVDERSVASLNGVWLSAVRASFGGMRFADPQPARMRTYSPRPPETVRLVPNSTGDNLSAVLWQLCQDAQQRQELTDWLTEFLGPEVTDIDFELTESGDVLLRIVDAAGAKISARSMSDGTLRFLYMLAQLRVLGEFSPLVIEDLEQGLHPQRCRLLVDAIAEANTPSQMHRDGRSVIATTHSADVIEATLRIPYATVLLFAQDPSGHGTLIRDVRSLPQFDEVCKRRDFGYLLNSGWLERAV